MKRVLIAVFWLTLSVGIWAVLIIRMKAIGWLAMLPVVLCGLFIWKVVADAATFDEEAAAYRDVMKQRRRAENVRSKANGASIARKIRWARDHRRRPRP